MNFEQLQTFRQEIHQLLTKAKDATFELMDAAMTTRHASSLAEFSLSPMFRPRYPSTHEALEDSWQLKQVLKHCQQKVLVLLDREYGNAKWVIAIAELLVGCVTRIRTKYLSVWYSTCL
jgi:hypothetical protein